MDAFTRVLAGHFLEVFDERFVTIADVWVVLDVLVADVFFDSVPRTAFIEHQRIEILGALLVLFEFGCHVCHSEQFCFEVEATIEVGFAGERIAIYGGTGRA